MKLGSNQLILEYRGSISDQAMEWFCGIAPDASEALVIFVKKRQRLVIVGTADELLVMVQCLDEDDSFWSCSVGQIEAMDHAATIAYLTSKPKQKEDLQSFISG